MDGVADRNGFVVVYPDGSGFLRDRLLIWNAGDCCGYAKEQGVDDVAFVWALIDDVTARLRTDPARVFVTGFSNGAMMAYRLGCELADRIAAIAVVSGAMNLDACRPSRPLPVLVMHGTDDGVVPYAGGPTPGTGSWINRSVEYAVDFWTAHGACPRAPAESRDGEVVRAVYASCAEGTTVAVYTIEGGRHGWPGGEKAREDAAEPAPLRPDASTVIWEFFSTA
jgi:polyhydroxybutyrate depolymerase